MREQVEQLLNMIREALQRDGGDIELLDVNEETGEVLVQLQGTCAGCPYSQYTLTNYVEKTLKEHVPGVTKVINKNLDRLSI
ncbi:MAG: NifU family protein [Candidatus Heimdallarchaeaceae archaeon]